MYYSWTIPFRSQCLLSQVKVSSSASYLYITDPYPCSLLAHGDLDVLSITSRPPNRSGNLEKLLGEVSLGLRREWVMDGCYQLERCTVVLQGILDEQAVLVNETVQDLGGSIRVAVNRAITIIKNKGSPFTGATLNPYLTVMSAFISISKYTMTLGNPWMVDSMVKTSWVLYRHSL